MVLLLALVLALLGEKGSLAGETQHEKVYRHSEDGAPRSLDPVSMNSTYANTLITAIYDTLYEYRYLERPFRLKPNLADAMPDISKDGLTLKIPLKKGVHFADDPCFREGKGRELVAEDVVYFFKRHFDPKTQSTGKWLGKNRILGLDSWGEKGADYKQTVAGLRAIDPYTVEVKLTKPFPQFLYTLATGYGAIVPHEAVAKYGKELAHKGAGSGPWQLTEFHSKKAELRKNPNYRHETFDLQTHGYNPSLHAFTGIARLAGRRLPLLDRIEVHFFEQESVRWQSFTKGSELQYSWLPSVQLDQVLESRLPVVLKKEFAEKFHQQAQQEAGVIFMQFNMAHPEFGYHSDPQRAERNKALRCAIRKGFHWKQLIDRSYNGLGEAYPGIIPPGVEGYEPSLSRESITLDIAGAKELLKKNAWHKDNLPELSFSGVASVKQTQFYELFRNWMLKIGYPREKVQLKTYPTYGDYAKAIREELLPFHGIGWGLDYPDGENTLQLFYGPHKSPGANTANYQNPAYDRLYEQAASMQAGPERAQILRQANQLLIDDCVVISGFSRTHIELWHKNVVMLPSREVLGNYFKYIDIE